MELELRILNMELELRMLKQELKLKIEKIDVVAASENHAKHPPMAKTEKQEDTERTQQ